MSEETKPDPPDLIVGFTLFSINEFIIAADNTARTLTFTPTSEEPVFNGKLEFSLIRPDVLPDARPGQVYEIRIRQIDPF